MYFVNEVHQENYERLMHRYRLTPGKDIQYESSIYIAAYPEIYTEKMYEEDNSPLYAHMRWNEEKEMHIVSSPELTGSTRRMVEVGLSLYNGYPVELDDVFGSITNMELQDVVFQAMKIRARR
ncbi:hypothetical protein ACFVAD_20530 [Sutcliffiella sp. NPDC057660]|uniref:hypothetical protein n=1 Tax=Sutcliffiella sp. NPDC057660 TaxID=3346199 RepID=UPI0036925BD0